MQSADAKARAGRTWNAAGGLRLLLVFVQHNCLVRDGVLLRCNGHRLGFGGGEGEEENRAGAPCNERLTRSADVEPGRRSVGQRWPPSLPLSAVSALVRPPSSASSHPRNARLPAPAPYQAVSRHLSPILRCHHPRAGGIPILGACTTARPPNASAPHSNHKSFLPAPVSCLLPRGSINTVCVLLVQPMRSTLDARSAICQWPRPLPLPSSAPHLA